MTNPSQSPIPTAPDPAAVLEIPPAPPIPKRDWRRALELLRCLREDSTRTDLGMEMMDALGGYYDGDEPFQLFAAHPEGRRMLQERPCLVSRVADRQALARLPDGSFGRAYLDVAERSGISADALIEMTRNRPQRPGYDPLRTWFEARLSVAHDLQHVLTGYGTDPIGENALLLFTRGQGVAGPGLRLLTTLMMLWNGWRVKRFIWEAYRRGRRAQSLIAAPYERLLPMPLAQVREQLGVGQPEDVHPAGILEQVGDEIVSVPAAV